MATARSTQVDPTVTPYYHCVARCVRRAYLCGEDLASGRSFDHRKQWIVDRIRHLGELFAVNICAYAVMSNHFHLVLRIDLARSDGWQEQEILERYGKLFPVAAKALDTLGQRERTKKVNLFRARLCDLSWMMRALNEWIARKANKEDGCTGRFWEGRFRSQALLDDKALLTCMSYVDLNPVRAGIARGLEDSEFTSIQERLEELAVRHQRSSSRATQGAKRKRQSKYKDAPLAPFEEQVARTNGVAVAPIPMLFSDYVELLEWTGRALRTDKRGTIEGAGPRALAHAQIEANAWLAAMNGGFQCFGQAVGEVTALEAEAERRDRTWLRGKGMARRLFSAAA